MASARGATETARLKTNIENQLNRLLTQLNDLDEMKEIMEESEYISARNETLDQMAEFEASLEKMMTGDMTLVDDLGKMQLSIQNAIRNAFKSPEVILMFEKKENNALRSRLSSLEESFKLGRISENLFSLQRKELLEALLKLGEVLTDAERSYMTQSTIKYASATSAVDDSVMSFAATANRDAK